jgi:hypothetical protein
MRINAVVTSGYRRPRRTASRLGAKGMSRLVELNQSGSSPGSAGEAAKV